VRLQFNVVKGKYILIVPLQDLYQQ